MLSRNPKPKNYEQAKQTFGTAVAAELTGLSQGTVKRYCREGRLPCTKPKGKYLFDRDELQAFMKKGNQQ